MPIMTTDGPLSTDTIDAPSTDAPSTEPSDSTTLLIETTFDLITNLFNLTSRHQWLRRKALELLRLLLFQPSFDDRTLVTSWVSQLVSSCDDIHLTRAVSQLNDHLWPPPSRHYRTAETQKNPNQETENPNQQNQENQSLLTPLREWIFSWLDGSLLPSSSTSTPHQIYIYRLFGRSNTDASILRLLDMIANKHMMLSMMVMMVEVTVQCVFSKDMRKIK
jgi:hypothetical protein